MGARYEGSCLCGAVRYVVEGAFDRFYLCHCDYCRKDTGSAHAANLIAEAGRLTWLAGAEVVRQFSLPSTRHRKSFCTRCGSALPGLQMEGALLVVPAGSVDGKVSVRPSAHIFASSRADWDDALERVPSVPGFPDWTAP